MSQYVTHANSFFRSFLQDKRDHVTELRIKTNGVLVLTPELHGITIRELCIEIILLSCFLERIAHGTECKHDDTESENVNICTLIWLLFKYFGSHIHFCSTHTVHEVISCPTSHWKTKTKIYEFDSAIGSNHNVFTFYISVGNTGTMQFCDGFNDLSEYVAIESVIKKLFCELECAIEEVK